MSAEPGLKRSLGAFQLWSLAVGLVISGEYFGWSYGWSVSGPIGFLVATMLVALLYMTLVFSLTELTTAIPEVGGPFAYATRALGPTAGFLAGLTTTIEFLFAPPAIAFALGSYLHVIVPAISTPWAAVIVLGMFAGLNLLGVHQSARFEAIVTVIAVAELLVFIAVVAPHFQAANFLADGWRGGWGGVFASIPYAIWFFLAIEGVAMAAEEVRDPSRDIPIGYLTGILTLVVLALGVMLSAGGVGDWRKLSQMDYPIPEAVAMALGRANPWVKALAGIGLFGLVASLNGIVYGASRQIYAVARAGLLPRVFTRLNRHRSPDAAVLLVGVVGVISVASGKTSELITLSAIGAVQMYILCMLSVFGLRRREPDLPRPFRAPFYPAFPAIALLLSVVCLGAMVWYNPKVAALAAALVGGGTIYYRMRGEIRLGVAAEEAP